MLFSLYIDPLLEYLRISGYGGHMTGVYIGALSYADDIIGGLNEMLKCVISWQGKIVLYLTVMLLEMKKHI